MVYTEKIFSTHSSIKSVRGYLFSLFFPGVSAYVSERQGGAPHTEVSASVSERRQGGAPHTEVGRSRGPLEDERARRGLIPAAPH